MMCFVACGNDTSESDPRSSIQKAYKERTGLLIGDGEPVLLRVEIADDDEERARGLMYRDELGSNEGMFFIFFEPTTGSFWMKNTTIPLSIALVDADGTILEIMDMDPCTAEPCKLYEPSVEYQGALEVNQGAFEEWGISVGDEFRLTP